MDDRQEQSLKEACEDSIGVAYVENILSLSDNDFADWIERFLSTMLTQTLGELRFHMSQSDRDAGNCEFGLRLIAKNCKIVAWITEERRKKFLAIENPA